MSLIDQASTLGLRALFCIAATCLSSACGAGTLNLDNTWMRSTVHEREPGVRHEIIHEATGAVLDERHLVKNDTGKPDARVHATLTELSGDSYLLQLQSQDQGSADHYRIHVRVELPKEACYGGYWYLTDLDLLSDDLVTGARPIVYNAGDRSIDVSYHRALRGPMHFTGGQMQLVFRVVEMCF